VQRVQEEIDALGVETDGKGWRAKVFLYCVETTCPQTGWSVPLLPSRIISKGYRVIAELVPDPVNKRYGIEIRSGVSERELKAAESGTIGRDSKYDEAYLIHQVGGETYKTKISTLRGDTLRPDGSTGNRLRMWETQDFVPRPDDLLQERLYCIQWMRPKSRGKRYDYEFRTVMPEDIERERAVEAFIGERIADWQAKGWLPDMRIEVGGPPRYQGLDLIKARGWTYWHHAFNPRQLLVAGLLRKHCNARAIFGLTQVLNRNSRLSHWDLSNVRAVFYNQALSTLYAFGCRGFADCYGLIEDTFKSFSIPQTQELCVKTEAASSSLDDE
jgi:putative DNA methylase